MRHNNPFKIPLKWCLLLLCQVSDINRRGIGVNHDHAQLGLLDNGLAIKEFVSVGRLDRNGDIWLT